MLCWIRDASGLLCNFMFGRKSKRLVPHSMRSSIAALECSLSLIFPILKKAVRPGVLEWPSFMATGIGFRRNTDPFAM